MQEEVGEAAVKSEHFTFTFTQGVNIGIGFPAIKSLIIALLGFTW